MESTEWIHEAIIRYLKSPFYTAPVLQFIDENCIIFDTEEENKFEYTEVHEKFKTLVDDLVSYFLEELGVSTEAFVEAMRSYVPLFDRLVFPAAWPLRCY